MAARVLADCSDISAARRTAPANPLPASPARTIPITRGGTESGARIRLVAASPETTDAVHAFLLFQIVDHQTGDAATIGDNLSKK